MRPACALLSAGVVLVAGCARDGAPEETTRTAAPARSTQLANPATTNCANVGGRLSIEKNPAGGEVGICVFEDNHQCEEWALLRGECPVGGRRITGYATQAGRYCAITGGQYTDVTGNDSADERGNCVLPGGKVCEAEAYWRGACAP
jgi:putative hemolysin